MRATLDEFYTASDLSAEPLKEALEQVQEAIARYRKLVSNQHTALKVWGDRLTALGIPREGFTIDDTTVTISAGNLMGSTAVGEITIGDATVEAIHRPNRFLVDAINDPSITGTDHRTPIEEVTRIDRRS
ncbi:hypothetical protein VH571_07310 [Frondihabitans sp. 4ASC-45]|uniref:hypothetical protein n=1 Tax=Frondihabitans sp. 4ASC-45 TaxID=3111636 RepID=UPI003C1A2A26